MMDKRFREIAEYAYDSVPLYIRREKQLTVETTWEEIPVLKKNEILKDPDSFYSCKFLSLDREKEVLRDRTSGSTGKYLELYWHRADAKKSLLPVWLYRKKYYGISPKDKMCYFYTTSNTGYRDGIEYEEERTGSAKGFSKNNLNRERMLEIYKRIMEYQPAWMFLQPSMAVLLCDAAEKTGKDIPSLRYIEFTGELLTKEVKERTEKTFRCRTANHYGCNEVHTIAFECPCGNMHVAERNVYVEIVDDNMHPVLEGTEGRILITSAANRIMPFIRYDIGDRGLLHSNVHCRCGCKTPVLELTKGRVHDYVEVRDVSTGKFSNVNAYVFVHAVEAVNRLYDNCIRQFRIEQKSYEELEVKLSIDEEVYEFGVTKEMLKEAFVQNVLQKELENMRYVFRFCEELFPEEGKLLWFWKKIG